MNTDQSIPTTGATTVRGQKLDPAQKIKLEKAVREFESVFVGYMLKSMRKTIEKPDNSTDSFGGDMLEGMFDVELSKHISKNGHLGMADMLYRKMTGESQNDMKQMTDTIHSIQQMMLSRKASGAIELDNVDDSKKSGKNESTQGTKATDSTSFLSGKNSQSLDERLRSFDPYIAEASEKFGVSDSLIKAVMATESSARSNVQSPKNAKGLMQLIDSTASEMGVKNVWNPRENIMGGTKYLKQLLEQFDGDETLAVASYNAGPGAVQKHGGVPPYKETKDYVTRVMNFVTMFEQQENGNE